jgi:prevent-host-death family protein
MARTIAQRELRNRNAEIIDAVTRGDRFIVTRNGTPVAELRPFTAGRRRIVPKADVVAAFAGGIRIDAQRLHEDLDRLVDQQLA